MRFSFNELQCIDIFRLLAAFFIYMDCFDFDMGFFFCFPKLNLYASNRQWDSVLFFFFPVSFKSLNFGDLLALGKCCKFV